MAYLKRASRLRVPPSLKWKLLRRFRDGVPAARAMGVGVGDGCRIYSGEFGTEPWLVTIGSGTTISIDVKFLPHDGVGWLFRDDKGRRYSYRPITVGKNCFVGAGAIVMPGVSIGDRSVVGAGSVVVRDVEPGSVVAGNPASVRGAYEDLERRVLTTWASDRDMTGAGRRERIDSIVDWHPR